MTKLKLILILSFSLALIACGGGGGSSSENTTGNNSSTNLVTNNDEEHNNSDDNDESDPELTNTEEQEEEEEQEEIDNTSDTDLVYDTTAELIVPDNFNMKQEFNLQVFVSTESQAFISICSDFSETSQGYTVNYSDCLLQTSVDGSQLHDINVPNDKSALIAAVWYLDRPQEPQFYIWDKNQMGAEFSIY